MSQEPTISSQLIYQGRILNIRVDTIQLPTGRVTTREIVEILYPGGGTSEHATVQKLLERLEARRCAARRREGRNNVWSPSVAREELIRDRLHDAAERLCEGSLTPLLTQLVNGARLTDEDMERLRELVARHREPRS